MYEKSGETVVVAQLVPFLIHAASRVSLLFYEALAGPSTPQRWLVKFVPIFFRLIYNSCPSRLQMQIALFFSGAIVCSDGRSPSSGTIFCLQAVSIS